MDRKQGHAERPRDAGVNFLPVKAEVPVLVEFAELIAEADMLCDEENRFVFFNCPITIFVESIEMRIIFACGRSCRCPFRRRNFSVIIEIELGKCFAMLVLCGFLFGEFPVTICICDRKLSWRHLRGFDRFFVNGSATGENEKTEEQKRGVSQIHEDGAVRQNIGLCHESRCHSIRLMKKLFSILVLIAFALPALGEEKIDRSKVKPDMTEGIHLDGSTIFNYVDEKKRRRLSLDVYRPATGEGPYPAIVMYFGGGWQNGRPALFASLAQALAQRGYVCIVPEYRLSSEAPFPAAVHDAKAAIRWTRKNAKRLTIDPDRIATIGGSAGGHLSGFMGASNGLERFEGIGEHQEASSEVQASIVMCGPMDLLSDGMPERAEARAQTAAGDALVDFMGGVLPSKDPALYREASPITHLSKASPPMLFIDGEEDRPRVRYTDFWKKMDELEIPHEFVLMPDGPHPFWAMREWFDPTVAAVDAFLKKSL